MAETKPRKSLVNKDCEYGRRLIREIPEAKTFSLKEMADYTAVNIETSLQGSQFEFCSGTQKTPVQTRLLLEHNVANVVSVLGALDVLGFDPAEFRSTLREIAGIPGRMERVCSMHDFDVFVDYAHTPDAFLHVLQEARVLAPLRLLTLFGCGGDRDRGKRRLMTQIACQYSDVVILTSDNPRTEDPEGILNEMKEGLTEERREGSYVLEVIDRRDAIEKLISMAEPGDMVLLLGKGHEDYQILGEKKVPFDDRLIAKEFLDKKSRVFLS